MCPLTESDPSATVTTILVVDDAAEIRHFCRRVLESEGYQVLEAADGAEALELLQALDSPIDVVVTDLIMPKLNGIALADRLVKVRPQTPV